MTDHMQHTIIVQQIVDKAHELDLDTQDFIERLAEIYDNMHPQNVFDLDIG